EAARALAQFYLKNTPADQKETSISAAFERIVCRKPQSSEQKSLTAFYRQQWQHYHDQPLAAQELLQQTGPYPIDTTLDTAETCALMLSIQILYNLDEVLSKT
ncbi:MAG: hypothetical protein ACOYPR_17670, partial [Saprospiraceae bacterium]